MLTENIYEDHFPGEGVKRAATNALSVETRRGRVIGYTLTPNHRAGELHPAMVMLHGFPGICNNHDLAMLFCNAGFAVVVPNAPGAWGSEGFYSFDGIIDAACDVVEYVHTQETCEKYHIDRENIFVFGHSMGGFTAVNAAARLPFVKGFIFAAPCNLGWECEHPETGFMEYLNTESEGFLRTNTDLTENAKSLSAVTSFEAAAPSLCGRNFLLIECAEDTVIPKASLKILRDGILEEDRRCSNVGNRPESSSAGACPVSCNGETQPGSSAAGRFGSGVHRYALLPTDHGFNSCKFTAAKTVIGYCREVMNNRV